MVGMWEGIWQELGRKRARLRLPEVLAHHATLLDALRPREIDEVEPSLPFDAVGLRADGHVQRKHQMR